MAAMWERILKQAASHLGLLVTGFTTVIVALKILFAAAFDLTVAISLASAGGPAAAFSILLQVLPPLSGMVAVLLIALLLFGVRHSGVVGLAIVGSVLALLVAPAVLVVVVLGSFVAQVLFIWATTRKAPRDQAPSEVPAWYAIATGGLFLGTLLALPSHWLPAERIAIAGGDPMIGYVIAVDEWTTIQREDDRSIILVRSEDVESRGICRFPGYGWGESLAGLLSPNVTPPCGADEAQTRPDESP
jgi:hypothetical protein